MPTIIDPLTGRPQPLVTGIYIARGDDTLGPYNSAEAAALVIGGYLRANDQAARNGDATWVPLAEFLPSDFVPGVEPSSAAEPVAHSVREAHPHRWRRLTAAFAVLLAVPLMIAGGARWWEGRRAVVTDRLAVLPPAPVVGTPAAAPSPSLPAVAEERPLPPPSPAVPAGPARGSVSLTLPDGGRTAFAGVRVTAYPLAVLENGLAPAIAAARDARERLDPQIEAAAAERTARAAEEQSALQAWRESPPADPMRPSMRFAYTGARTATRTAEDNYRYLLDERTTSAGGEVYFHGLPAPAVAAETDAEGNFTLDLPADDTVYAVAASVRPAAADDGTVHSRYWLVKLSPAQRSGREPLRLDASNLTSSADAGSLVHTAD